jgi:hypothetical protein
VIGTPRILSEENLSPTDNENEPGYTDLFSFIKNKRSSLPIIRSSTDDCAKELMG